MDPDRQTEIARNAVRLLAVRCPRLTRLCYWAGTASIAIEELHHRQSFDLDFHTRKALENARPILAEMRAAFRECLAGAGLKPSRQRALAFLLS